MNGCFNELISSYQIIFPPTHIKISIQRKKKLIKTTKKDCFIELTTDHIVLVLDRIVMFQNYSILEFQRVDES
jgi:hypothetical protein